jgi:phosphatidylglycerophosphate synthase
MLYQGERGWWIAALVTYAVLGLTDAIDGILARRQGVTAIGALLDPVADKIFVVAAYGPLADLGILPLLPVVLLFVRELGVTVLRSISIEERFSFKTSRIAKLKTAVQMGAAGFILLFWIFPGPAATRKILAISLLGAVLPLLIALLRRKLPNWVAVWAFLMVLTLAAVRLALPGEAAISFITWFVAAITLVSGAEYAWGMRDLLARRFRARPLDALRFLAVSLAVPVFYLPALAYPGVPRFTVFALLGAELAAGGLDNSLVHAGAARGPLPDLLRALAQAVLGGFLLAELAAGRAQIALALGLLALALTLADLGLRFLANWRALAAAPTTGSSA